MADGVLPAPRGPVRSAAGRARRAVARVRVAVVRTFRRAVHRWRSSMQLRVVTTALAVGFVAVAALGTYLSSSISSGLFDQRIADVERESVALTSQVRTTVEESSATQQSDLTKLLSDVPGRLQAQGSSALGVYLMHELGTETQLLDIAPPGQEGLLTDELRRRNLELREQDPRSDVPVLQSVAIPTDGEVVPGVMVGSTVQGTALGSYEIYFLYSLQEEQETLLLIQRVLLVGAVGILVLIGVITRLVTRQTVLPVTRAATVAERLADGHLSERMPVGKGKDEMASLARSFNEMAASLQDQIRRMEELSTLQRRFVSDVSHELRTPLTTIRMASEVIHAERDDLQPGARRSAELLQDQIDRFESLLADLLEISRFDAGAAVLDAERHDLRDLVTQVVEQAMPLAERKEVTVSVRLPDGDAVADVDSRRVERILRNLVVNAIEHAEERPVEVTVAEDRWSVAVVVRDYGVGMTQPEVEHVFDRFWRADPARARTTGGTGLGLAIALEDARLHAGRLEAWGRPGRGASFRLALPRRVGLSVADPPVPLVPPSHEPRVSTGQVPVINPHGGPSPTTIPDLPTVADEEMEVR